MDAPRPRCAHGSLGVPSDADGKLFECCPFRKRKLETGVDQASLRILAEGHAGLPQFADALWPEPREVDEAAERQQRLVGGDVGGRLLSPDVLLTGLKGQDIAALARGVYRLADDAPRHAADEFVARSEESVMRAGEGLIVARTLPFADRHAAAVGARRLEHAH